MTKKRYPKTTQNARSTPHRSTRAYPFERRYAALQGDDEHPIDVVIGCIPRIARLNRKLVRDSRRWQDEVREADAYRAYEDQRLAQRCLREEAFFDAGHAQGRVYGATEALGTSVSGSPQARAFAGQILIARLTSGLSAGLAVAVLLELARGLVVGERLVLRPSNRGRP